MIATKGYGFTPDMIDWSSPADMEPYMKSHEIELKERDYMAWLQGQYFASALDATVCNNELWRKKGSKPHKYVEKPFLESLFRKQSDKNNEDELQKQRELFVARFEAMGANFRLSQKNKGGMVS